MATLKQVITASIALIAGLGVVASSASGQPRYVAVDLGILWCVGCGPAARINNSGQIVCSDVDTNNNVHALFYSGGNTIDLGSSHYVKAINNLGQIVGYRKNTVSGNSQGFFYDGGVLNDDLLLSGGQVFGINDSGAIVGITYTPSNELQPCILTNGVLAFFPQPDRNLGGSEGGDINDSGQVVCTWVMSNYHRHGFLYSEGTMVDLGTLPRTDDCFVTRINNSGQIVGYCWGSVTHAFVYTNGGMHDLGTLDPVWSTALAYDINNSGQIVGGSIVGGSYHGFLYTDGTMYDLNSLLVNAKDVARITHAGGINDSGQIIANGSDRHAYLLKPILIKPLRIVTDDGQFGFHTGRFSFNVSSTVGSVVTVESSTNMVDWNSVATLTNQTGTVLFVDPAPNQSRCFYRLRQ